jgi:hypothetical protein
VKNCKLLRGVSCGYGGLLRLDAIAKNSERLHFIFSEVRTTARHRWGDPSWSYVSSGQMPLSTPVTVSRGLIYLFGHLCASAATKEQKCKVRRNFGGTQFAFPLFRTETLPVRYIGILVRSRKSASDQMHMGWARTARPDECCMFEDGQENVYATHDRRFPTPTLQCILLATT